MEVEHLCGGWLLLVACVIVLLAFLEPPRDWPRLLPKTRFQMHDICLCYFQAAEFMLGDQSLQHTNAAAVGRANCTMEAGV